MSSKIAHAGVISDISENVISVRIIQNTACSECHAKSACRVSESKEKIIEIPNRYEHLHVGDNIIVEGSAIMGLKAVLYAFVLPLVLIVAVLILSIMYIQNEAIAACLSVLVLALYYCVLYIFRSKLKKKFVFHLVKN